jgi:hypothetical protein
LGTGGCLGVVGFADGDGLDSFVSDSDRLDRQTSYKTEFLGRTVRDQLFQDLDRRVRLELLSMDGVVIMDHRGQLLAAGAIVQIDAGSSSGGGRSAAAQRLSKTGLGIKVSADGPITAFKSGSVILRA